MFNMNASCRVGKNRVRNACKFRIVLGSMQHVCYDCSTTHFRTSFLISFSRMVEIAFIIEKWLRISPGIWLFTTSSAAHLQAQTVGCFALLSGRAKTLGVSSRGLAADGKDSSVLRCWGFLCPKFDGKLSKKPQVIQERKGFRVDVEKFGTAL